MKKIILSVFFANQFTAQTFISIPDPVFASVLMSDIPSAMTGNQLNINSPLINTYLTLNLENSTVTDLTGISYLTSLQNLDCSGTSIVNFSTLPNSLTNLDCRSAQLTILPNLPNSLLFLLCGQNSLTALPANLPPMLQDLQCDNNQLTYLPVLPSSLNNLDCAFNNITCFLPFSTNFNIIHLNNNPNLNCLPNYVAAIGIDTLVYPICNLGNSNGCIVATGITTHENIENQLSVSPNPSNGNIFIENNNLLHLTIELYNVDNKLIYSQYSNERNINVLTNITPGIYFLSIANTDKYYKKKVVITN